MCKPAANVQASHGARCRALAVASGPVLAVGAMWGVNHCRKMEPPGVLFFSGHLLGKQSYRERASSCWFRTKAGPRTPVGRAVSQVARPIRSAATPTPKKPADARTRHTEHSQVRQRLRDFSTAQQGQGTKDRTKGPRGTRGRTGDHSRFRNRRAADRAPALPAPEWLQARVPSGGAGRGNKTFFPQVSSAHLVGMR